MNWYYSFKSAGRGNIPLMEQRKNPYFTNQPGVSDNDGISGNLYQGETGIGSDDRNSAIGGNLPQTGYGHGMDAQRSQGFIPASYDTLIGSQKRTSDDDQVGIYSGDRKFHDQSISENNSQQAPSALQFQLLSGDNKKDKKPNQLSRMTVFDSAIDQLR